MVASFPAPIFPEQTTLPCFCPHPAKLHQHPASSLWILKITRRIPDKNLGLLITTTFISAASFISQALGFCCILCQAAWICDLFALIGNNDQRSFPDADLGILSRKEVIADSDGKPVGNVRPFQLVLGMADADPAGAVGVAEYRKMVSLLTIFRPRAAHLLRWQR